MYQFTPHEAKFAGFLEPSRENCSLMSLHQAAARRGMLTRDGGVPVSNFARFIASYLWTFEKIDFYDRALDGPGCQQHRKLFCRRLADVGLGVFVSRVDVLAEVCTRWLNLGPKCTGPPVYDLPECVIEGVTIDDKTKLCAALGPNYSSYSLIALFLEFISDTDNSLDSANEKFKRWLVSAGIQERHTKYVRTIVENFGFFKHTETLWHHKYSTKSRADWSDADKKCFDAAIIHDMARVSTAIEERSGPDLLNLILFPAQQSEFQKHSLESYLESIIECMLGAVLEVFERNYPGMTHELVEAEKQKQAFLALLRGQPAQNRFSPMYRLMRPRPTGKSVSQDDSKEQLGTRPAVMHAAVAAADEARVYDMFDNEDEYKKFSQHLYHLLAVIQTVGSTPTE